MGGIITASAGSVRFFRVRRELKQLHKDNEEMKDILSKHQLLDELKLEQKIDVKNDVGTEEIE